MKLNFMFIAAMLFATSVLAAQAEVKSAPISELVDQYYQQKSLVTQYHSLFTKQSHPPIGCQPSDSPTCFDSACNQLGSQGCDDISEIQAVSRACRGNYNGVCINAACRKLGPFGCDDISEIESVARACVGSVDSECLDSVCKRLGQFGCDDISEIETVLRTCSGY